MNSVEPTKDPEPTDWERQLSQVTLHASPLRRDELLYQSGYAAAKAEAAVLQRSLLLWRSGFIAAAAATIAALMLSLRSPSDNEAVVDLAEESVEALRGDTPDGQPSILASSGGRDVQPESNSLFALSQQLRQGRVPQPLRVGRAPSRLVDDPLIDAADIAWALEEI